MARPGRPTHGGNLERVAHASQRSRRQDLFHGLVGNALGHPRFGEAGGHGVDGHSLAGVLASEGLRQADHPRLGGRVVGLSEIADLTRHARHVNDPAPAPVGHLVDEMLGDQEDAGQVCREDLIPGIFGELLETAIAVDGRVVDQDVDGAEVALDFVAHRLDLGLHGHIVGVVTGLATEVADGVANLVGGRPPVLQLMATSAPAWARAMATARPMPRELPVTNAFLPNRLKSGT